MYLRTRHHFFSSTVYIWYIFLLYFSFIFRINFSSYFLSVVIISHYIIKRGGRVID